MKKYEVTVGEYVFTTYAIEAENEKKAAELVLNGYGEEVYQDSAGGMEIDTIVEIES